MNHDPDALHRRNQELAILNAIARALNGAATLDEALTATLGHLAERFDLETGWVWLLDESSGEHFLAAARNLPPALAKAPERMAGGCYCLDTYREGDLAGAANVNVVRCSRLRWLDDGTRGLRYHASVPINAHGRKLGVLNLGSTDWRELSEAELQLLHTAGDLVGIAVERARLFERSIEVGALEERNRLAREIHDTVAQALSAIVLQLESAEARAERVDEASIERLSVPLSRALALARGSLEDVRRSVLDLRAAPLEGRTLAEALQALAERSGLRVTQRFVGAERPLPTRVEVGLYRIAQEALANVARHAGVAEARLALILGPEEARLSVADDGRGFDPEVEVPQRHGLVGMRERARLLGGALQVATGPGEGTRVEASVPLGRAGQGALGRSSDGLSVLGGASEPASGPEHASVPEKDHVFSSDTGTERRS